MENKELKNRLAKVYELVKQGGTEGEKAAAKNALDRLIEKHNLHGIDLDNLDKSIYKFKYATNLHEQLLLRIVMMFTADFDFNTARKSTSNVKEIHLSLTYLDYVTVSASYEYFKRHMMAQWKKISASSIKRKRSTKTRNQHRKELQLAFFSRYVIESGLYKQHELKPVNPSEISKKQLEAMRMMHDVEGGKYNRQMTNGLLLD